MSNKIINYNILDSFYKNKAHAAKNSKNGNFYANNARLLYSLAKLDSIEISKKAKS